MIVCILFEKISTHFVFFSFLKSHLLGWSSFVLLKTQFFFVWKSLYIIRKEEASGRNEICLFLIGNLSFYFVYYSIYTCLFFNFVSRNLLFLSTLQRYGGFINSLIGVYFNFRGEFFNLSKPLFLVGDLVYL